MSSVLYKQAYTDMVTKNAAIFARFSVVHDQFKSNNDKYKSQFDNLGKQVVRLIEETETRLCSKMENSGRGTYSANLAEKFHVEVKSHFPLIDLIGVIIS